jgi:xanthine dehydrogenase YagR molybdenum-binding subunit
MTPPNSPGAASAPLAWPDPKDCTILGKRTTRLDGPDKTSGRAKYTYDVNRPRMLWAKFTTCPHGHARVKSVDVSAAEKAPGVVAVEILAAAGTELSIAYVPVAVVAAESEEAAQDAVRRVQVEYEVLAHQVVDHDPELAGSAAKPGRAQTKGEPDDAFAGAAVTSETDVGCSIITHCCLESHGAVVEVEEKDGKKSATVWASTQMVSPMAGEFTNPLGLGENDIHVICEHMGGGFGSKFGAAEWGRAAATLATRTGRPVKVMLERDMELALAGSRPSAFASIKVGMKDDGEIVAFESHAWGAAGNRAGLGVRSLPYVFGGIPHQRTRNTPIVTNTGNSAAWRAPDHPQMCLLTMAALADAAAELGMDELEFFRKNLKFTDRAAVYEEELSIAAELMDWKKKWRPRGESKGVLRRGLGLAIHTWGGTPNDSNVQCTLFPDGAVELKSGTQDLGPGARTVIGVVAAELLGLPISAVKVLIGDNRYPPAGPSGGSTTTGGIASATLHACTQVLEKLFEAAAPELGGNAGDLAAKGGKVLAKGDPSKSLSFADACRRLGTQPLSATGSTQRQAGITNGGVGGAQMAEVEVDVETGIARVLKMVAVQDCGRVIDLLTAESQVRGALIMGVCAALYEERIMDPATGTVLNPDLEFYKLAGIADVGELVVHMMDTPAHTSRGVIGLGEPPVISPMAAISNAVANAIGARVRRCPMTPDRVLAAVKSTGASR